jgi:hypothetical protein
MIAANILRMNSESLIANSFLVVSLKNPGTPYFISNTRGVADCG